MELQTEVRGEDYLNIASIPAGAQLPEHLKLKYKGNTYRKTYY